MRDGLSVITGAGSNVVLLRAAAAAALVDSGPPEHAAELAKLVQGKLGGLPVEALFNTHWHPTHTGGNEMLRGADTTIVAHELTRLWMSTEYYVDWEDRTYTPRAAAALPTKTFYATDPQPLSLRIGDEQIEYGHLPEAHTDGDVYVLFKQRNVLVTGGVVTFGAYPVLDYTTGGWIGGLVEGTKKLLDISNADTLIVPAARARATAVASHGAAHDADRRPRAHRKPHAQGPQHRGDARGRSHRRIRRGLGQQSRALRRQHL